MSTPVIIMTGRPRYIISAMCGNTIHSAPNIDRALVVGINLFHITISPHVAHAFYGFISVVGRPTRFPSINYSITFKRFLKSYLFDLVLASPSTVVYTLRFTDKTTTFIIMQARKTPFQATKQSLLSSFPE